MREIPPEYQTYLVMRSGNRVSQQPVSKIDYLTAAANYVDIHVGPRILRTRSSISDIEQRLDPRMFGRIHRSTIVNFDRVKGCQSLRHGDYMVTLKSGIQLRMSRQYRTQLEKMISFVVWTGRYPLTDRSADV